MNALWTGLLTAALALTYRPATVEPMGMRGALMAWDDSLQHAQKVSDLDALSRNARKMGGTSGDIRYTLYILRRGELNASRPDIELAMTDADWIAKSNPQSPWCPYIKARAYTTMVTARWMKVNLEGQDLLDNHDEGVWRGLREALDKDAQFTPARQLLVQLLVPGGDRTLRPDQRVALERVVSASPADPDALLAWGRHLRTFRQYDSALAVFNHALAAGGDTSRLELERARTLRAVHDTVYSAIAYWNGVKHLTPIGREMYHHDLAWILEPDSLATFDRIPDDSVQPWLERFWNERDAAAAHHPGERLEEHLRRWVVAFARYRVVSPWRRTAYNRIDLFFDNSDCNHVDLATYQLVWKLPPVHAGDIRAKEWLLDHRGIIYLHHGEPIQRFLTTDAPSTEDFDIGLPPDAEDVSDVWPPWLKTGTGGPHLAASFAGPGIDGFMIGKQSAPRYSEVWLFQIEGEQRLLNFRDSYAIGMYGATTLATYLPYSPYAWDAMTGVSPEYRTAIERYLAMRESVHPRLMGQPTCWNEMRAVVAKSREDVHAGTHSDTDSPPLLRPWGSVVQMFALGHERDTSGEALITFALQGNQLKSDTGSTGSMVYDIAFRIVAYERKTGKTVTIDTVRHFTNPRRFAAGEALTTFTEIPLTAGDWQIAVRARQDDEFSGIYSLRRDVHIDGATDLALSDIVTGISTSPPWVATDGTGFPVNALASWPVGSTAELFYEVHGVAEQGSYRTTVEVKPIDPKSKASVRIVTSDISTGPVTRVRKSLGLEQLPAGKYQVTVTIDAGGKQATRERAITIRARP